MRGKQSPAPDKLVVVAIVPKPRVENRAVPAGSRCQLSMGTSVPSSYLTLRMKPLLRVLDIETMI